MKSKKIRMITYTALFAALTCIATMIIRIPTPTKGYVNLGDCIVNISAWILGPAYGAAAAGIGSAFADIMSGYMVYAPATLVIKGIMAAVSFGVVAVFSRKKQTSVPVRIMAAVAAELVMAIGYMAFETVMYGSFATAMLGIPGNIAQGVMGVISSVTIYEAVIKKLPDIKHG